MKLIAGNSNRPLAEAIAQNLGINLTQATIRRFADMEVFVEILENVRGEDVFIIQPTSFPANDTLMELLIMIDALRRASARRITAVIPYFGYARQDRKTSSRSPITAKLVSNIITTAGAHRVLTLDLHAGQIQGFFDIPVDNLFVGPRFHPPCARYVVGAGQIAAKPDGCIARCRRAWCARARWPRNSTRVSPSSINAAKKAGESEVMHIIGDVEGHDCIMLDDIVDSAGTLCNASQALKDAGAKTVTAYVSHGVLSGMAVERVNKSPLEKLIVTDSIEATPDIIASPKIKQISIAPLMAEAIIRISQERSVSSLFS